MIVTDFSAGELSKTLFGRVDIGAYYKGGSFIENFEVIPTGGIRKRAGTRRVGTLLAGSRLIPFIIDSGTSYILELAAGKIRAWKNGVLQSFSGQQDAVNKAWTKAPATQEAKDLASTFSTIGNTIQDKLTEAQNAAASALAKRDRAKTDLDNKDNEYIIKINSCAWHYTDLQTKLAVYNEVYSDYIEKKAAMDDAYEVYRLAEIDLNQKEKWKSALVYYRNCGSAYADAVKVAQEHNSHSVADEVFQDAMREARSVFEDAISKLMEVRPGYHDSEYLIVYWDSDDISADIVSALAEYNAAYQYARDKEDLYNAACEAFEAADAAYANAANACYFAQRDYNNSIIARDNALSALNTAQDVYAAAVVAYSSAQVTENEVALKVASQCMTKDIADVAAADAPLFAAADLFEVQYAQSFNKIILVHRNNPPVEIVYKNGNLSLRKIYFNYRVPSTFNDVYGRPELNPEFNIEDVFFDNPSLIGEGNYPGCVSFFGGRAVYAGSRNYPQRVFVSAVSEGDVDKTNVFSTYKRYATTVQSLLDIDLHTVKKARVHWDTPGVTGVFSVTGLTYAAVKYYLYSTAFPPGTKLVSVGATKIELSHKPLPIPGCPTDAEIELSMRQYSWEHNNISYDNSHGWSNGPWGYAKGEALFLYKRHVWKCQYKNTDSGCLRIRR